MTRRGARRAARVLAPLAVAAGAVTFAAAPALAASASFTMTSPGGSTGAGGTARLGGNATVTLAGQDPATGLLGSRTLKLTVLPPSGSEVTLASKSVSNSSTGKISASYATACPQSERSCTYEFHFRVDGDNAASKITLVVAPPPAAPANFAASASGTVVTFGWATVGNVDGYRLYDGSTALADIDPTQFCSATACGLTYDYGPAAYSTTHTFHVVSLRDGASGDVESASSDPSTVEFPAPPPSPSPSGSGGTGGTSGSGGTPGTGGGTGGTNGSAGGGSTGGGSGGGHATAAHDLRTQLPTTSAGAAPNLPSVITEIKPLPEGTYKQTLNYPPQVVGETTRRPTGTAATVAHDIARVFDVGALWRGLAGAAVLMLVAAHLRAWVARVEPE